MNITQVFKSSADGEVVGELEIGGSEQATPIPAEGDKTFAVSLRNKIYQGPVTSRLISYSAPDNLGLERSVDRDFTAELTAELAKG